MLSTFRSGAKSVVLGSSNVDKLSQFLSEKLNGTLTNNISSALGFAEEDNTVVFITEPGKNVANLKDVKAVIVIPMPSDAMFSTLINLKGTSLIEDSHIAPGVIIMRVLGDCDKIIESVHEAYGGNIMSHMECLDKGTSGQTIISFTEKPLNYTLSIDDLKPQNILVDINTDKLNKRIRNQALRFLNEGLVGVEWNDLQIRIYDIFSKYTLHYQRLSLILDNLDMGLVLGESWAKDYPRFLMSVLVYQVRFITLRNPVEIKKILLGLEHLDDGKRIVDLDLMHGNKKVSWPQALQKDTKKYDRSKLGVMYRKELLEKLSSEDREKMFKLEEEILESRY